MLLIHGLTDVPGDRPKIPVGDDSIQLCEGVEGGAVLQGGYLQNLPVVMPEYDVIPGTDGIKVTDNIMISGSPDLAYAIAGCTKKQLSDRGNRLQAKQANQAYVSKR